MDSCVYDCRQTVKTIQQAKSTLQFSFAPFFFYFVSSVIYTLYAIATANVLMGATALLGSLLGSYYVYVFYTHAGDKVRVVTVCTYTLCRLAPNAASSSS